MKTKKRIKSTTKKPTRALVIEAVFLTLIICSLTYIYIFNGPIFDWKARQDSIQENNSIDFGPATKEQIDAGNQVKSSSSSDTPTEPTIIPGSDKKSVQVSITAANQNDSTLQIRTLIGAVENTGLCTITLTSEGKTTVIKTAIAQALARTSTCQGFDIPVSEISIGTWHVLVEYNSDTLTGSATQDIVIK